MTFQEITITANEADQRCDRFLKKYLRNSSAGNIYKLLRKKIIRVNGKKVQADYRLLIGDIIQFRLSPEKLAELRGISDSLKEDLNNIKNTALTPNFQVLYEDKNILIVNKPAGVIVQPDQKHRQNSLVDMVKKYLFDQGDYNPQEELTFSPASINRLDLNTSGIVIFAKNYASLKTLNKLMREKKITKLYTALIKGTLTQTADGKKGGELSGYLYKDPRTNKVKVFNTPAPRQANHQAGRTPQKIVTRYQHLYSGREGTLVEIELVTGKAHQIRAHFQSIGHPLAGDPKYGDEKWNISLRQRFGLKRQFLHAHAVTFQEGSGILEYLAGKEFTAPLPADLQRVKL